MTLELYTLYVDGQPRALMIGHSVEHCLTNYRQQNLGQRYVDGKENKDVTLDAKPSRETPTDEFLRLAMTGLYMQMFAAAMAQGGGKH